MCSCGCSTNTFVIHSLIKPHMLFLEKSSNNTYSKPLKLGTWHFYTVFITCQVSHVPCHVSNVFLCVFFDQLVELVDGGSVNNGTLSSVVWNKVCKDFLPGRFVSRPVVTRAVLQTHGAVIRGLFDGDRPKQSLNAIEFKQVQQKIENIYRITHIYETS